MSHPTRSRVAVPPRLHACAASRQTREAQALNTEVEMKEAQAAAHDAAAADAELLGLKKKKQPPPAAQAEPGEGAGAGASTEGGNTGREAGDAEGDDSEMVRRPLRRGCTGAWG